MKNRLAGPANTVGETFSLDTFAAEHEVMCHDAPCGDCTTCRHLDAEGHRYEPCPHREAAARDVFDDCEFWELGR